MRLHTAVVLIAFIFASPALAGQNAGNDRFQAAIGLARVKRDAGDFTGARRYFEEARRIQRFDAAQLAEFFWVLAGRDAAAALAAGNEALAANPDNHQVRDRTITEALALQNEAAVVSLAAGGRVRDPRAALWPRRMAESFQRQHRPEEAAEALRVAVGLPDSIMKDRIDLALSLEAAKRYSQATEAWATVPSQAVRGRVDLEHSRLRALALAGIGTAGAELDVWLSSAPDDKEMRALAVDAWMRAGNPGRALTVAAPLEGEEWIRRRAAIARAAGRRDLAIAELDALGTKRQTPAERHTLVELLLEEKRFTRATQLLATMATSTSRCEPKALALIDRLPGDQGTRLLLDALASGRCDAETSWLRRGIDRAVASGDHASALRLIGRLPPAVVAASDDVRRLTGQLRLWTGDVGAALPLLEAALSRSPGDVAVRESLVDVYRAQGRPTDAWLVANPLLSLPTLTLERRLALAELAIEVERPLAVDRLVGDVSSGHADQLRGRAALISGRAPEARRLLSSMPVDTLQPAAALALIDAVNATSGIDEARSVSRLFPQQDVAWRHVIARRHLLEVKAGQEAEEAALRAVRDLCAAAMAAWNAGDKTAARTAATRAIELDEHAIEAWLVLADTASGSGDLDNVLARFENVAKNQPELIIPMAERLSGYIRSANDPIVSRVAAWLDQIQTTEPGQLIARDLAKARVFSAVQRWPEALAAVTTALSQDAAHPSGLKLRAELLSWSGRHAEAMAAYDIYLAGTPADVEARRQQARVAGWAGYFAEARRLYNALKAQNPDSPVVNAEATAKTAYFDGRWDSAAIAYTKWVALEPSNGEARFELAEALRAAGQTSSADATLSQLAATGHHRIASSAQDRARVNRAPSASVVADSRQSSGYNGQRLLDLRRFGAGWQRSIDTVGRATLAVEASGLTASDGSETERGYQAGVSGNVAISPGLTMTARAGASTLGQSGRFAVDGSFGTAWRVAERWSLGAGLDRARVTENLGTVRSAMMSTGAFASSRFDSPQATFDMRVSRDTLSDGNARTRATLSMSRAVSERLSRLRMIGWTEVLAYRSSVPEYFSPGSHVRADLGLQYTHALTSPRFRNDRQRTLSAAYLVGIDDNGAAYHHPMLGLSFEFANGVAIEARGNWIRSSVYRETSLFVGLTLRPGSRVE